MENVYAIDYLFANQRNCLHLPDMVTMGSTNRRIKLECACITSQSLLCVDLASQVASEESLSIVAIDNRLTDFNRRNQHSSKEIHVEKPSYQ